CQSRSRVRALNLPPPPPSLPLPRRPPSFPLRPSLPSLSPVRGHCSDPGRPRMITNTRGFLWSDLETRALLEIWGEADVQSALDGNFRNSHVYRDVACRLAELGFERTPEQCRIRIKGLKRQYYQARDGLKKNGHARKICKYYDEMDRILSCRGGPDGAPEPLAVPADGAPWMRTPSSVPPATTSPRTPASAPPTPTTPSRWSAPPSPSQCRPPTVSSSRPPRTPCIAPAHFTRPRLRPPARQPRRRRTALGLQAPAGVRQWETLAQSRSRAVPVWEKRCPSR
uniref:Myb/SANT-like DNA-binding domain-containing protein n=1 Tax=Apteryx owenii TaxID=8824 RepID=A0A8B9Q1R4_APTOW